MSTTPDSQRADDQIGLEERGRKGRPALEQERLDTLGRQRA
jgi:hypothetical protein